MYQDKTLICQGCGTEFIFTAGEQEFFATRGLINEPKRCRSCREARKTTGQVRESTEIICANCGVTTVVPFKPRGDRPVYCRECLRAIKGE